MMTAIGMAGGFLFQGLLFVMLCILIAVVIMVGPELWRALSTDYTYIYEAECKKCNERFCPPNKHDLTHQYTEFDWPCGGEGKIIGKYKVESC